MVFDTALLRVDGRAAVRLVRHYPAAADRVWAAVGEPHGLATWFPASQVSFEPRVGAAMTFAGDPHDPGSTSEGTVTAYEPGSSLRFAWGPDQVWFDVTEAGDESLFTLTDVLGHEDTAARTAAGWTVCLAALDASLGQEPGGPTDWRAAYEDCVAQGFPHGAPIPSP